MDELLDKVIEYMEAHDELPGMSDDLARIAFTQYISHNAIDSGLAELIEKYNELELSALDYCEYIINQLPYENDFNAISNILGHRIGWYYREWDVEELPESEEEHIRNSIKKGYYQGELSYYNTETDTEHFGWWQIL